MALALDGSVHGNTASGTSLAVSLSTSTSGLIFVAVVSNGGVVNTPTATGLTFAKRQEHEVAGQLALQWETVFWADSSAAVSSKSITTTQTNSAYLTVDAWGVSGCDRTTKWDSDVSLPAHGEPDPISIDTDQSDDLCYGAFRTGTQVSTAGSGWTLIQNGDYDVTEYKIVAAPQTGLSVSITTGVGTANGVIGDAVIAAAGGGGPTIHSLSALGVGI